MPSGKAMFKVGDRVRIRSDYLFHPGWNNYKPAGEIFLVRQADSSISDKLGFKLASSPFWWPVKWFELDKPKFKPDEVVVL